MKKRVLILFILSLGVLKSFSQENVFVLVDVSGSIDKNDMAAAKQALIDLLLGNPLSNANVPPGNGSLQDLAQCKIKVGDKLSITKFGNKQTILSTPPLPVPIQSIPNDIYQIFSSSYPQNTPGDGKTYLTLAKAKVAEYAKSISLRSYKLYVISDNITDDFGHNGKPDYSDYERDLTENYGSTTSGIRPGAFTRVKLNNCNNKFYVLELTHKVDISQYQLPPGGPTILPPDSSVQIKINNVGPKATPVKQKGANLNIMWSCTNCPQGAKFTLVVSNTSNRKYRPKIPVLSVQSYTLNNVPAGEYRISVSGQNFNATDTGYVTVDRGSGAGWVIPLLLLLAAGAGGYWYWNRKRQKKLDEDKINKEGDMFSPRGNVSNNSSGTSGYF
jgi:hypothetical protein